MKRIISLFLVFLMVCSNAFAVTGVPDSPHWIPVGFGGAGRFSMVIPDHFTANKIYAIPDVNAPYVSTNAADSWSFLSTVGAVNSGYTPTQTAAFIQSKNTEALLYALDSASGGLVRSTDGGQHWTKVGSYKNGKSNKAIALDPNDDNNIYVASQGNGTTQGGRIYRSTNGGTSFSELFRPFDASVSAESAELSGSGQTRTGKLNNKNNILKGSVVFTSSGGETFTDNGSGVLVSNMGGSGTITYSNISSVNYGDYSLTFGSTPSTTTVSYTVSNNPTWVYVTSDGADLLVGREASSGTAVVRYNIAGETITPITPSGTNATYSADYDTYVDGSAVENICVTAGYTIACSDDKGDTWTYTAAVTTGTTYYIRHFAVRRKADTTLSFVITRRLISNQYSTVQQYSTDSGATWSSVSISKNTTMNPTQVFTSGSANVGSINFDPNDEDIVYLSTDWMICKSVDGGATFAEKDAGAQNIVQTDIAVDPLGGWWATSMDTGIQHSSDKGTTWTQGTPDISKGQPYVTGSIDDYGGHYWRIKALGTYSQWAAGTGILVATATMYGSNSSIYTKNFVIRSTDSGATFSRTNSGLPTTPLGGDTIWGQFFPNKAGGFARSIGVSADESKIYIGMDGEWASGTSLGGLFMSEDYGENWTRIWSSPRKIYNALAVDPTDSTGDTLMFGTFGNPGYNTYRRSPQSETAELNGSGQTRTGTLNKNNTVISNSVTFTSASGEVFTDNGSGGLTSNLGGTGTISYSTGAYSLTFVSTPSTTTASYGYKSYVGDSSGPGDSFDIAYDSNGTPYSVNAGGGGASIYKSVVTQYGNGSGEYGTWQRMKKFASTGIADALLIDPRNDKRIFVGITNGSIADRRIYVTVDADKHTQATWYDITGDFPVVGGCQSFAIDYSDGDQGSLICASNGGGLWKKYLDDTPASFPGRTCVGGCNE